MTTIDPRQEAKNLADVAMMLADNLIAGGGELPWQVQTPAQLAATLLALAWGDMVRRIIPTWPNMSEETKREYAIAAALWRQSCPDSGLDERDYDPIVACPGTQPTIIRVGNQEAVCVEYLMAEAMPLSVQYIWRLRALETERAALDNFERQVQAVKEALPPSEGQSAKPTSAAQVDTLTRKGSFRSP